MRYGIRTTEVLGVIMVYDSQYTKDACTLPPHVPTPLKNRTAIVVCRQLVPICSGSPQRSRQVF